MEMLKFTDLDENLFQAILVISATKILPTTNWLERIIDNSKDKDKLEFQPVLENGTKLLKFDLEQFESIEPIRCHRCLLDNKYYITQIYLVQVDDLIQFPEQFFDYIHGAIVYFDNNDSECLKTLNDWTSYIDSMENCAIKILACETATEHHPVKRIDIQNFCIDKGFELIELAPEDSEPHDDDLEDDLRETVSFERLYKAIQAYVWPNMNYKEKSSPLISLSNNDLMERIQDLSLNELAGDEANLLTYQQLNKDAETDEVSQQEADNFEDMFAKFSEIKEKASKLPDDERRKYAEQIAMAFWNSISDDKEETFSSDEDNEPNHVYI